MSKKKKKKKVWKNSQRNISQIDYWELDLYSPLGAVKDKDDLRKENLVHLHPRRRIASDFPQSNDPDIDIVIIQPQIQQLSADTRGKVPCLEPLFF